MFPQLFVFVLLVASGVLFPSVTQQRVDLVLNCCATSFQEDGDEDKEDDGEEEDKEVGEDEERRW